jgi:hypothetical protein
MGIGTTMTIMAVMVEGARVPGNKGKEEDQERIKTGEPPPFWERRFVGRSCQGTKWFDWKPFG